MPTICDTCSHCFDCGKHMASWDEKHKCPHNRTCMLIASSAEGGTEALCLKCEQRYTHVCVAAKVGDA